MDIALLSKDSLKIKGKRAYLLVDPVEKSNRLTQEVAESAAVISLNSTNDDLNILENTVVINGPGEYETGGIKMSATRIEGEIVYNPKVDGVDIILGKITSLEKLQHKLKDQNILIAYVDSLINASFITSLASNVIILYGEKAQELVASFGKENIKTTAKYSVTVEKLPQEVETVILG